MSSRGKKIIERHLEREVGDEPRKTSQESMSQSGESDPQRWYY